MGGIISRVEFIGGIVSRIGFVVSKVNIRVLIVLVLAKLVLRR